MNEGSKQFGFCTMHETRAYGLAKHLRNAGLSPELEFGRAPHGNWIYRSTVKCRCTREQWDAATDAMYAEEPKEAP